jgi:beta-N-acetylhexosaminidase
VLSILAGADMLEGLGSVNSQVATFEALEAAEREGRVSAERIAASLERLRTLARRYPITPNAYNLETFEADVALAQRAWGRGICAVGDLRLPAPGSAITLIAATEVPGEYVSELGINGTTLAAKLEAVYRVKSVLYDARDPRSALAGVRQAQANGETVVFASTSRRRLSEDVRHLAREAQPSLHLALWNPYATQDVPAPALVTFGYRPEAIAALIEVLRGERAITGIAPVMLEA